MDQLTSWACAAPTPSAPVATSAAAANSLLLLITDSPEVADHDGRPSTTRCVTTPITGRRERLVKLCEAGTRAAPGPARVARQRKEPEHVQGDRQGGGQAAQDPGRAERAQPSGRRLATPRERSGADRSVRVPVRASGAAAHQARARSRD